MYLLGSDAFKDLASRDRSRAVFGWLAGARPGPSQLFASVISLGVLAFTIEQQPAPERDHWRRLLAEARRDFAGQGALIDIDAAIAAEWSRLRGLLLHYDDGEEVGDDELLVVATALARDLTLVARREGYHQEIADRTALQLVEP